MKWLADENIPGSTIAFLRQHGQEVFSVARLAPSAPDEQVIQIAVDRQCILLSFDRDHGDLIFGQAVTPPPAVVYLRLYPSGPEALEKVFPARAGMNRLERNSKSGRTDVPGRYAASDGGVSEQPARSSTPNAGR